jgi:hypothetical protein
MDVNQKTGLDRLFSLCHSQLIQHIYKMCEKSKLDMNQVASHELETTHFEIAFSFTKQFRINNLVRPLPIRDISRIGTLLKGMR